jgi:hypothetical protein
MIPEDGEENLHAVANKKCYRHRRANGRTYHIKEEEEELFQGLS